VLNLPKIAKKIAFLKKVKDKSKIIKNKNVSEAEKARTIRSLSREFKKDFPKVKVELTGDIKKLSNKKYSPEEKLFLTVTLLATGGIALGGIGGVAVALTAFDAFQTVQEAINFIKKPSSKKLGRLSFYALPFTLKLVGKSPAGRAIKEEILIRKQPKEIQPFFRAIIKSSKTQEKLKPIRTKKFKNVLPYLKKVKEINSIEAKALLKTLKETDSIVYGSLASYISSGGKTPIPKDVDLGTKNIKVFVETFINNLPKKERLKYYVKKGKLFKGKNALFDIKGYDILTPAKNVLTGKGQLPITGFEPALRFKEGSFLPFITKKPSIVKLTMPTQKRVTVGGIKITGFGEQTTRKGLGTLQVLIEKNSKRAKDPQAFLTSLLIQLQSLKKSKPLTFFGKARKRRRIKRLENAINILSSKKFANLLNKKVPGLTKKYPLINKLSPRKLKRINKKKARNTAKLYDSVTQFEKDLRKGKVSQKKEDVTVASELQKKAFSKLPSGLTASSVINVKKARSRVPSKLKKDKKKSKIPSKVKSKTPSKLRSSKIPSRAISRIPSRLVARSIIKIPKPVSRPPSRVPSRTPSKVKVSKLPRKTRSKLKATRRPSRLPRKRTRKRPKKKITRIKRRDKKKETEQERPTPRRVVKRKFIYLADLYSRFYGIQIPRKKGKFLLTPGRVFKGFEARPIVGRKR
jgi:hypothetical protein